MAKGLGTNMPRNVGFVDWAQSWPRSMNEEEVFQLRRRRYENQDRTARFWEMNTGKHKHIQREGKGRFYRVSRRIRESIFVSFTQVRQVLLCELLFELQCIYTHSQLRSLLVLTSNQLRVTDPSQIKRKPAISYPRILSSEILA